MNIGPEVVCGDLTDTVKWAIAQIVMAGQSVDLYGVVITARLGYEYDVDGDVVPSKDVHAHVLKKLETRRVKAKKGGFTPRTEPYDSKRTRG